MRLQFLRSTLELCIFFFFSEKFNVCLFLVHSNSQKRMVFVLVHLFIQKKKNERTAYSMCTSVWHGLAWCILVQIALKKKKKKLRIEGENWI